MRELRSLGKSFMGIVLSLPYPPPPPVSRHLLVYLSNLCGDGRVNDNSLVVPFIGEEHS